MMTLLRTKWLPVLVSVFLSSSAQSLPSSATLRPGQMFPNVALVTMDGRTMSTHAFRGRTLILNVWATWCAACREEMASLQRLSETVDRDKTVVIGVSADSDLFRAREYVRGNAFSFAQFIDPDLRLARPFLRIATLPTTFVIAPDGQLVEQVFEARNWFKARAAVLPSQQALE